MIEPGTDVDRYQVIRALRQGGMATVYLVRHRMLGSMHALKVLTVQHRRLQERLWLEGKAQARLRHPNLVAVTDVVDVGGAPGLVMEYIAGGTLEEQLRSDPPTLEDGLALFSGILAGVEAAHAAGLVHRDLKPGNVLVDRSGPVPVPKVADFGLVKVVEEGAMGAPLAAPGPLTRTGGAMGTPAYMAPEQIRDARDVDQRADVFALGCILYEIACGRQAFTGDDVFATQEAVVHGWYTPVDKWSPGLDARIVRTVQACLAVDRAARPLDCAGIRVLLEGGTLTGTRPASSATLSPNLTIDPSDDSPHGTAVPPGSDETIAPVPLAETVDLPGSQAPTVLRGSEDGPPSWAPVREQPSSRRGRSAAFAWVWAAVLLLTFTGGGVMFLGDRGAAPEPMAQSALPLAPPAADEPAAPGSADGAAAQGAPEPMAEPVAEPMAEGAVPAASGGAKGAPPAAVATARPSSRASAPADEEPAAVASPAVEPLGSVGAAPSVTATSASSGGLAVTITSRPYATVQVDGKTWRAGGTIPAGRHTLRWECAAASCAGQTHQETVTVGADTASFCWDFSLDAWCRGGGG